MVDMVECPAHGEKPLVPSFADPEFMQCRGCWYREWLVAVLRFGRRRGDG